jgi:hypothetical protein
MATDKTEANEDSSRETNSASHIAEKPIPPAYTIYVAWRAVTTSLFDLGFYSPP